jgi:hypothetical protein
MEFMVTLRFTPAASEGDVVAHGSTGGAKENNNFEFPVLATRRYLTTKDTQTKVLF